MAPCRKRAHNLKTCWKACLHHFGASSLCWPPCGHSLCPKGKVNLARLGQGLGDGGRRQKGSEGRRNKTEGREQSGPWGGLTRGEGQRHNPNLRLYPQF